MPSSKTQGAVAKKFGAYLGGSAQKKMQLYDNLNCEVIFERYTNHKTRLMTLQTLANELSTVTGFQITRSQADYQLRAWKAKERNPGKMKQQKLNFSTKIANQKKEEVKPKSMIQQAMDEIMQLTKHMKSVGNGMISQAKMIEAKWENKLVIAVEEELMEIKAEAYDNLNNIAVENANDAVSEKSADEYEDNFSLEEELMEASDADSEVDLASSIETISIGSEHDTSPSSGPLLQPAPQVRMDNKGKIQMKYHFAKNSKMKKTMVVVNSHGSILSYVIRTKKGKVVHYVCNRCPRGKSCSKAKMENDEFWMDPHHGLNCKGGMNEMEFEALQLDRDTREEIWNGMKPQAAFLKMFDECNKKGLRSKVKSYEEVRKSYTRRHANRYPKSVRGQVAEDHKWLLEKDRRWLIHEDPEVAVFCSDLALKSMAKAKILAADPTFKTSPAGCEQVLYIHGLVECKNGSEWRPLLMAPMTGKSQVLYERVVDAIKNRWKELGVTAEFGRIHLDYEKGLQNAFEKLGGKEKVHGCLFHYDQAVLRYIKQCGLFGHYQLKKGKKKEYKAIREWIRSLMALPMLSKEDALFLWERLRIVPLAPKNYKADWPTDKMEKFVSYMERIWIPLLLKDDNNRWCFYNMGRTKNTNVAESYHQRLNADLPRNARYAVFLEEQKLRFETYDHRLERLQNENIKTKPINKMYNAVAEKIKELEDKLEKAKEKVLFKNSRKKPKSKF